MTSTNVWRSDPLLETRMRMSVRTLRGRESVQYCIVDTLIKSDVIGVYTVSFMVMIPYFLQTRGVSAGVCRVLTVMVSTCGNQH